MPTSTIKGKDGAEKKKAMRGTRSLFPGFMVTGLSVVLLATMVVSFMSQRLFGIAALSPSLIDDALRSYTQLQWTVTVLAVVLVEIFLVLLYRYLTGRERKIAKISDALARHAHEIEGEFSAGHIPLRTMLEQLREGVSALPILVYMTDRNGVISLAEGGALERVGLGPALMMGKSLFEVYGGFPEIMKYNHDALEGKTHTGPVRLQGRDYVCRFSPLRDDHGKIRGVLGAAFDVTELEHAREALKLSQRGYERLVQLSPVGILIFVDGEISFANEAAARLLAAEEKENLIGMRAADFLLSDDEEQLTETITLLRKGGEVQRREAVIKRIDGTKVRVAIAATPYTRKRKPASLVVVEDIEGQREAENAKLRLAAIVDSANDAIIGKTLDGTITSWNRAAERLYGYTDEEAVGRSIYMLAPDDKERKEIDGIMERLKRGERTEPFVTRRMRKDGRVIDVDLTVSPVRDADGKVTGASAVARRSPAAER